MAQAYTTAELVAQHKASLLDAAAFFIAPDDADFLRHLRIAGRVVAREKRPRTIAATVTLEVGQSIYPAPTNLVLPKVSRWGVAETQEKPWCTPRTPLPTLRMVETEDGVMLDLSPAPSAAQITAFGTSYPYYYVAAYEVPDAGNSGVTANEVDLILLRAKVEALRELSIRNSSKPVTLRDAQGSGTPRNTTPPALYEMFLREYREAA